MLERASLLQFSVWQVWQQYLYSPLYKRGGVITMNAIIPACVAVLTLFALLFVTLGTLTRNMAVTKPANQARNIKYLITNAIIMSVCLIVIMVDIATFIKPME